MCPKRHISNILLLCTNNIATLTCRVSSACSPSAGSNFNWGPIVAQLPQNITSKFYFVLMLTVIEELLKTTLLNRDFVNSTGFELVQLFTVTGEQADEETIWLAWTSLQVSLLILEPQASASVADVLVLFVSLGPCE